MSAHGIIRLSGLEAQIADRIAPTLVDLGYELVRLSVLGHETPTVQVMADKADGSLISVDDCEQISHAVGAILDVDDPIPGAWTLEVSSSGIDRPLTRLKDWERFTGHLAKAEMDVALNGRKRFAGIVMGVKDDSAVLRLDNGEEALLPLSEMRKARLVLTDELIEACATLAGLEQSSKEGDQKRRVPKLNPKKTGKKN
ncbi:ribosome maturation factor RimP [Aristophania vespae]|uniref:Ribosome maturation factor RimP n=1 Tax=Aristophania vespae TaxID=2697033 RepID=A0A6P1NHP1_9PROT|nr:ribosome maturation factor RimP [Aristophania vespae]QHI95172.1 ribosome maturation factor RimP [Aristophania vespae]UMM64393.1 Ribosome maturation factor RimP [Aristophania vespae]